MLLFFFQIRVSKSALNMMKSDWVIFMFKSFMKPAWCLFEENINNKLKWGKMMPFVEKKSGSIEEHERVVLTDRSQFPLHSHRRDNFKLISKINWRQKIFAITSLFELYGNRIIKSCCLGFTNRNVYFTRYKFQWHFYYENKLDFY